MGRKWGGAEGRARGKSWGNCPGVAPLCGSILGFSTNAVMVGRNSEAPSDNF